MFATTIEAIRAILTTDPAVSPAERNRLVMLLRQGPSPAPAADPAGNTGPRFMRRQEVAQRLSVSLRTVDKYAVTGVLQKRTLQGRKRASGFLAADVEALLTGAKVTP